MSLSKADEAVNRPRHERRSSREDLDVRRSSDPPGRQPPTHDQPPARRPPGAVGGESLALSSALCVIASGAMDSSVV
jgi:hypothetical protein